MDGSTTKSSANAAGAAANPMLNATNAAAPARPHSHNDLNASSKLIGPQGVQLQPVPSMVQMYES